MTSGPSYRVVVIPDRSAINDLLSGRTGDLRRVMAGFAGVATRNARSLAAQRLTRNPTGRYQRSIASTFPRPDDLHIEANVPYAAALELGTTPHGIVGTRPPDFMLKWPPSRSNTGGWVKIAAVDHPGNRPYRILTDAVIETGRQLGF